jgi:hypothetical protein
MSYYSFEDAMIGGTLGFLLGKAIFGSSASDTWEVECKERAEKERTQAELRKLREDFEQFKTWRRS